MVDQKEEAKKEKFIETMLLCYADNSVILFPKVILLKEMKRLVNIN